MEQNNKSGQVCYGKDQVNHIDMNKLNNDVNNLEWTTDQENKDHARRLRSEQNSNP
jgi:hypothetical protein